MERKSGVNTGRNLAASAGRKLNSSRSSFRLRHLLAFAFEPVAVTTEHDDLSVVDKSIDHGGDGDGIERSSRSRRIRFTRGSPNCAQYP